MRLPGQSVNMSWLFKNNRFWRHHSLTEGEPLSPYFEGLEVQGSSAATGRAEVMSV
jgi:hypothetical protein